MQRRQRHATQVDRAQLTDAETEIGTPPPGLGHPGTLTAGLGLVDFRPRISSAGLTTEVEVRAWDPVQAKAMSVTKPVAAGGVSIGAGDPATAARTFGSRTPPAAAAGPADLGPAPSAQALVVFDRAVTVENSSTQALTEAATWVGADSVAVGPAVDARLADALHGELRRAAAPA